MRQAPRLLLTLAMASGLVAGGLGVPADAAPPSDAPGRGGPVVRVVDDGPVVSSVSSRVRGRSGETPAADRSRRDAAPGRAGAESGPATGGRRRSGDRPASPPPHAAAPASPPPHAAAPAPPPPASEPPPPALPETVPNDAAVAAPTPVGVTDAPPDTAAPAPAVGSGPPLATGPSIGTSAQFLADVTEFLGQTPRLGPIIGPLIPNLPSLPGLEREGISSLMLLLALLGGYLGLQRAVGQGLGQLPMAPVHVAPRTAHHVQY